MTDDLRWMDLHARTLYAHDAAGRIVRLQDPDGDPAPRLWLGRTAAGNLWRVQADLPDDLTAAVAGLLAREPPTGDPDAEPAAAALRSLLGVGTEDGWLGPAWRFPPTLAAAGSARLLESDEGTLVAPHFPGLFPEFAVRSPCAAVVAGGAAVAVCFVARRSAGAAEAGVETAAGFRGRGLAGACVAAWAAAIRAGGREPLYSTAAGNAASRRVAAKLGLVAIGSDWSVG